MKNRSLVVLAVVLLASSPAAAQVVSGPWVEAGEQSIDELRKAPLRVLVLDPQGRPVRDAKVRVSMLRHDFDVGVTLGADEFADGKSPAFRWGGAAVWRAFNSVSLDGTAGWERTEPVRGQQDFTVVDEMLAWAEQSGLSVRWGRVISADVGRWPGWAAALEPVELAETAEMYVRGLLGRYGRRVSQFDLYTELPDHDRLEKELGPVMVRRLFELGRAGAPGAVMAARFEDCLVGDRLPRMAQRYTALRDAFVPMEQIAIQLKVSGNMLQATLSRALDWLGRLRVPIVITGLEVGGVTAESAADELEMVLRTLFAHPAVRGLWFADIRAGHTMLPTSALVDEKGQPTRAGLRLEGLLRHLWWSDAEARTDDLGNVNLRVFAGLHDLFAELPDGSKASTSVYLRPGESHRVAVLQPLGVAPE